MFTGSVSQILWSVAIQVIRFFCTSQVKLLVAHCHIFSYTIIFDCKSLSHLSQLQVIIFVEFHYPNGWVRYVQYKISNMIKHESFRYLLMF